MTHPRLADTIEHTFKLKLEFENQLVNYLIEAHWWAWFTTTDKTALPEIELDRFWVYNNDDQEIIFSALPTNIQSQILNAVVAEEYLPDLDTYSKAHSSPDMECR